MLSKRLTRPNETHKGHQHKARSISQPRRQLQPSQETPAESTTTAASTTALRQHGGETTPPRQASRRSGGPPLGMTSTMPKQSYISPQQTPAIRRRHSGSRKAITDEERSAAKKHSPTPIPGEHMSGRKLEGEN